MKVVSSTSSIGCHCDNISRTTLTDASPSSLYGGVRVTRGSIEAEDSPSHLEPDSKSDSECPNH